MEDTGDPHFKRERPAGYAQHQPLHMPPSDTQSLHNYHHPAPQNAPMHPGFHPAPSPYQEGGDHRPPTEGHGHHQPLPPPSSYPPQQSYPPPSQTPTYPHDPNYSRQNSTSGPIRSPSTGQTPQYPPNVNGAPGPEGYYSRPDYNRQPYPPSESPANAPQPPPLHVQTSSHEMVPNQPPAQAMPPGGYPNTPHSAVPPQSHPPWGGFTPDHWYQQQQRRKPVRAAQACDSCRQRKAKCDEGRPECTHCKENGLRCTYRDVPPQKQEKQMLQMGEKVDSLADKLEDYIKSSDEKLDAKLDAKLDTFLQSVKSLIDARQPDSRLPVGSIPMAKSRSRPQTKEEPRSDSMTNFASHKQINAPFIQSSEQPMDSLHTTESSDTGTKHRGLGASDLLLWPGIKELVPGNIPVTYVMDSEVERGLLRLYGCGEGEDKGDGHDGAPSPAASNSSSRMDEEGSTSSPSGVWGTGHLPLREGKPTSIYDHPGGVTPNGELLLDRKTVDMYVKSYLERMHILHPFLDPRVLRKMVQAFKVKYSWDYSNLNRLATSIGAGSKRKRELSESPGSMPDEALSQHAPQHNGTRVAMKSTNIEHSVSNAIILLVIALGKICAHENPLPGAPKSSAVLHTTKSLSQQPLLGYGDLPPLPHPVSAPASPFTPHANGISAPPMVGGLQGKNMDVLPGLAYFAKAADILGELPGGVDVSHIQASLLAGLYMGQLARVIPSHWYIANACRACQILIRSPDYIERRIQPDRRNLINFAFWSCLQLESDILAEMDIPSSGIVHKEGSMLLEIPNALTIADPDDKEPQQANPQEFLRHYSNQIQLRRTLNDAVHNIYNSERADSKPSRIIDTVNENLQGWRTLLNEWDWHDDEHQSSDINHARMRGKYYGARYIINRPALLYALSMANPGTPMSRPSESPIGTGSHSEQTSPAVMHHGASAPNRRVSEMRPPQRAPEQLEEWIYKACQRCVSAAIRSTTVFDRVPRRLVITNILGTAHAQFGNVLVLAATFSSQNPLLREMVNEDTLRFLLNRTIEFLDDKAPISPALGTDAKILRHVQRKLFPSSTNNIGATTAASFPGLSANSSFSSNR